MSQSGPAVIVPFDPAGPARDAEPGEVTLLVENTYACGRETSYRVTLPAPAALDEDWWDEVPTGDGHPCGASEHAMYERTVVVAPERPDLLGETFTTEG